MTQAETIPDDVRAIVQQAYADVPWLIQWGDAYASAAVRMAERAIMADRAARSAQPVVRVKPLEWTTPPIGDTMTKAATEVGLYRVWTFHEAKGRWFWSRSFGNVTDGHEPSCAGADEAKAAAQADYEQRINSALLPSTDHTALLREAMTALEPFSEMASQVAEVHPGWDFDDFVLNLNGALPVRWKIFRTARRVVQSLKAALENTNGH